MNSHKLENERRLLIISSCGNLVIGCVGVTCALLSSSQAILLDGLFNLTYCATGLFTLKVARLVTEGDDERFPHGYAFFEPLTNGIKGLLVLGISMMALFGAVQGLLAGGQLIAAGIAVGYGVFASIACGTIAFLMHRGTREVESPLVRADAENWIVNAVISCCVLVAFAGAAAARSMGLETVALFVDPIVVIAVVSLSLGVPIRMSWNSLMELLNRAPAKEIVEQTTRIIDESLTSLPVNERFVRVIQPGRTRVVLVHVVLPKEYQPEGGLTFIDGIRRKTEDALVEAHVATIVDMSFTADRYWGAPASERIAETQIVAQADRDSRDSG